MKFFLLSIIILGIGCKKSADPILKFADNDIQVEVISSTGSSSLYSFHGINAPMYISSGIYGNNKFQAEGKINSSETKILVGVNSNDPTNTIVTCVYFPGGANVNSYSTEGVPQPGTISFSSFSNNYSQGSFVAKCSLLSDTVIIKGTFKGYYNN